MNITTKIKLTNGKTDWVEYTCDPAAKGADWHPLEFSEADAVFMAAEILHAEAGVGAELCDEDERIEAIIQAARQNNLGIQAKSFGKRPEKWSCSADGSIFQHGKKIGSFNTRVSYQHD